MRLPRSKSGAMDIYGVSSSVDHSNVPQMRLLRVFVFLFPALLAALCSTHLSAKAKETIQSSNDTAVTWCRFDLPPMYIADGPNAGKGIVDRHAEFLMRHMPEYQHHVEVSNIRRVSEQIRNRERVVCAGMQKNPEREEYMSFSLPFLAAAPPKIVLPRSSLERFKPYLNSAGEVRIGDLIDNSTLVLGISAGRSYGHVVDEFLASHPDHPRILVRPA
ncbi:MAG TPA: hypothetical protein VFW00_07910, partial [Rhodocyclaceae bacterium]|nr:hypothetical protein [Rhodocyclaceae bacterium]